MSQPLKICLTPVRNEDWCLNLFLECTSQWADYIIIADQCSIDKSKQIALQFPKVILLINESQHYNELERQRLLIDKAREIPGDKILFALDADELFSAGFMHTNDWAAIMNSSPGDVFGFQWANLLPDKAHYFTSDFFFPWVFHDDGFTPHENYAKVMHSMRIPYPIKADLGCYKILEFKVLHLAHLNPSRVNSKFRFYQFTEVVKGTGTNPISLFRTYNYGYLEQFSLPVAWFNFPFLDSGFFEQLNLNENLFWFDHEIVNYIQRYGETYFRQLYIWDTRWLEHVQALLPLKSPQNVLQNTLYFYLRTTQKYYPTRVVRLVDKALKVLMASL